MIGGQTESLIEEWVLKADQYKTELANVAKELRKQEKASKDLELVQRALGKTQSASAVEAGKLQKQMDATAAATKRGVIVGQLITKVWEKAGTAIEQMVRKAAEGNRELTEAGQVIDQATKAMMSAITATGAFSSGLKGIATAAKNAADWIRGMTGDAEKAARKFREWFADYGSWLGVSGHKGLQAAFAASYTIEQGAKEQRELQEAISMGPQLPPGVAGYQPKEAKKRGKTPETTLQAFERMTERGAGGPELSEKDFGFQTAEEEAAATRLQRMIQLRMEMAEEIANETARTQALRVAQESQAKAMRELSAITKSYDDTVRSLAEGSLRSLAGGMWSAVDAAVQGEMSFGAAMQSMAKRALMSVAATATGEGALEFARGLGALAMSWGVPNPKATLHFASAAKYGAIGLITGLAGVAIPGGGGGAAAAARTPSAGAAGAGSSYRPSSPSKKDEKPFQVVVQIYPDPADPSATAHWRKKIRAEMGSN